MILQIFLLLPASYIIFKTLNNIYYLIDCLEDKTLRKYEYLKSLFAKYDTDYKFLNTNINNINNKIDSLKLTSSQIIGDINKIKYNMDDLYKIEDQYYLENKEIIKNISNRLDSFDEDMKIMKCIYSITISELKDDINNNTKLLETKYNELDKTFINEKLSNELAFENIMMKIKENNTCEYKIKFNNINQIINETNISNIGTNYYINVVKSNYKQIDKEYKTCNYKCNNIINYMISILKEYDKIIICKANNNNILLNISYNINLTFYKNTLIGSSYDMCYIVPNLDIDNEYPKILKDNELDEYNKSIKLLNDNYELVKNEINNFIRKELYSISLDPLITNFLI